MTDYRGDGKQFRDNSQALTKGALLLHFFRGTSFRNDATLLCLHRSACTGRRRGLSAQARHDALLFFADLPDNRSVIQPSRKLAPRSRSFVDLAKTLSLVRVRATALAELLLHPRSIVSPSFRRHRNGEGRRG